MSGVYLHLTERDDDPRPTTTEVTTMYISQPKPTRYQLCFESQPMIDQALARGREREPSLDDMTILANADPANIYDNLDVATIAAAKREAKRLRAAGIATGYVGLYERVNIRDEGYDDGEHYWQQWAWEYGDEVRDL